MKQHFCPNPDCQHELHVRQNDGLIYADCTNANKCAMDMMTVIVHSESELDTALIAKWEVVKVLGGARKINYATRYTGGKYDKELG